MVGLPVEIELFDRVVQAGGRRTAQPAARIVIGGLDVSNCVASFQIAMPSASDLAVLTLDLPVVTDTKINGPMRVVLDDETHAALVALGWTPPAQGSGHRPGGDGASCPNRIDVTPAPGTKLQCICGCLPSGESVE